MPTIDKKATPADATTSVREDDVKGRRCDAHRPGDDTTGGMVGEKSSARLARLARWCVQGRLACAELELHQWLCEPACPTAARVLLASLLARRDADHDAQAVLTALDEQGAFDDVHALRLRLTFALMQDDNDAVAHWTQQLADTTDLGDAQDAAAWLQAVHWDDEQVAPPEAPGQDVVEQLADELRRQPGVIPSLVHAQRVDTDGDAAVLLRVAIEATVDEYIDDRPLLQRCWALAELALLADDPAAARQWALRGLEIDPYHATLALVVAQVEDDLTEGPSAQQVLARANEANPTYPDVEAALIRRQFAEGQLAEARWRLSTWQQRHPDHPSLPKPDAGQDDIQEAAA